MAFTADQKNNIRRYCGYYVFGSQPIQTFGWRYAEQYGHLEFLMNNLTLEQEFITINTYLVNLNQLEADIVSVRQNMDTKQAAVWYWNTNELRDRNKLYTMWRRYLCEYLGVDYGPALGSGRINFAV